MSDADDFERPIDATDFTFAVTHVTKYQFKRENQDCSPVFAIICAHWCSTSKSHALLH